MNELMDVYHPLPIAFEYGQGVWLWDQQGNKYFDAISGMAVTVLGHANPVVTKAIQDQASKLLHTSNHYQITNQLALAKLLTQLTGLEKAIFCNSGSEAADIALKLMRLYGHHKNIVMPQIIVMEGAYHGHTLATLAASGKIERQQGFEPLLPGFIRLPYGDIESIKHIAKTNKDVAAIMIEPIQGANGIRIPNKSFLNQVRELCDCNHWLLVLDEIQTGLARTGTLFCYQANNIKPDILILAKGLANGVPIGACLARADVAALLTYGKHHSTFGGNPLSTAAALATLQEMVSQQLWLNVMKQGELLLSQLRKVLNPYSLVKEIRGQGLMIGIELAHPCREILPLALKQGILVNISNHNTIRLLPPLIINEDEVMWLVNALGEVIRDYSD